MTIHRMLSAACMLGAFFAALLVESLHALMLILVAVFGALCLYEVCVLIRRRSVRCSYPICLVFALALMADGYLTGDSQAPLAHTGLILSAFVVVLLTWRVLLQDASYVAAEVGAALLATAYIGVAMAMALAMFRMKTDAGVAVGKFHLVFLVSTVFGADTAAYFVGRQWGRRRFFSRLSPNKTLEGAIGGVVSSFVIAAVLLAASPPLRASCGFGLGLLLGGLLGTVGTLGDLAESALKRDAGCKDSSNLLKGHGGFLDVFDGILFALPVQFAFVHFVCV
jgi:phosphatidate cytidylyltransferase